MLSTSTARLPLVLALVHALASGAAARPNILFICTDDQAAWTIGALGNPDARTPHLDRLYREGARLTNAFTTTPVCSPSRAGLMTSRYGTELGVTDYLNPSAEPDNGVDPRLVMWPEVFQAAGYQTAFVGKWHLGLRDEHLPTRNGYGSFYGFRSGAETSRDPEIESASGVQRVRGYTADLLTDETLRLLRRRDRDRPFLISLHFWAPHANTADRTPDGDRTWLPLRPEDFAPFRNLAVRLVDYPGLDVPRATRMMREYLGSVASVDRNLGRLLAALDELDLARNTLVVFTSDHGYNLSHHGLWHKGNGRWLLVDDQGPRANMFDHSLRTPAVVRWPAEIEAGSEVDEIVLNLDWYPTLLALAGLDVPQDVLLHGRDFSPLLRGESGAWRTEFYGEYDQIHVERVDQRMWRTPEWKLVRDSRPGKSELYHLSEDPEERVNRFDDPATLDIRRRLGARLDERLTQIGETAPGGR